MLCCCSVITGHTEGITYLCPKGDGYHLISNSKDQTVKLWDVRKALSPSAAIDKARQRPQIAHWDYRWEEYPGGAPEFAAIMSAVVLCNLMTLSTGAVKTQVVWMVGWRSLSAAIEQAR
jgi:WD40 repeat protein